MLRVVFYKIKYPFDQQTNLFIKWCVSFGEDSISSRNGNIDPSAFFWLADKSDLAITLKLQKKQQNQKLSEPLPPDFFNPGDGGSCFDGGG